MRIPNQSKPLIEAIRNEIEQRAHPRGLAQLPAICPSLRLYEAPHACRLTRDRLVTAIPDVGKDHPNVEHRQLGNALTVRRQLPHIVATVVRLSNKTTAQSRDGRGRCSESSMCPRFATHDRRLPCHNECIANQTCGSCWVVRCARHVDPEYRAIRDRDWRFLRCVDQVS